MTEYRGFIQADCMDVLPEIPDNYFQLAIVDPPYGGVTAGGYMKNRMPSGPDSKSKGLAQQWNDYDLSLWDQERPGPDYFRELFRVSENCIIWGGNYFTDCLPPSQCWVAWDKDKPPGVGYADIELAYTSFNRAAKIFRYRWNGMLQGDGKEHETKIHPTQKPVRLYTWLLANFAEPGDVILDTHVGSASSLIACEQLGFEYFGTEIMGGYYEEAKKRLDDFNAQLRMDWRLP